MKRATHFEKRAKEGNGQKIQGVTSVCDDKIGDTVETWKKGTEFYLVPSSNSSSLLMK